jgi:hypothetical protein
MPEVSEWVSGIAYLKAYRRRIITLFGKFRVFPSPVYYRSPIEKPVGIEAIITGLPTKKWPKTIESVLVRLTDGKTALVSGGVVVQWHRSTDGKREAILFFEGSWCEEILVEMT